MPTASTAALRKRRQEKKSAEEKLKDEAKVKEDAEKEQKCKVILVRNFASGESGKSAAAAKDNRMIFSDTVAEADEVVAGASEPAADTAHIELNTINVVGDRIVTTRQSDGDERVAIQRAKKRLLEEGEDVAAAAKGLNIDAHEQLFVDLENLHVSASQIVLEPAATPRVPISQCQGRDPLPSLQDFQPAPMWAEEPISSVPNPRLDSKLKTLVAAEYDEGDEIYPFDTFDDNTEQYWEYIWRCK